MKSQSKLLVASLASIMLLGIAGARIHARLVSPTADVASTRAEMAQNQNARVHQDRGVEIFRRSFEVESGAAIDVALEDADVVIESTSGSTIDVAVYIEADQAFALEIFADMEFEVALEGNTLYVEADDGDVSHDSWDDDGDVVTVLSVPRGTNVNVRTSDGDILGGALEGNVALRSADGDIVLEASLGGELELHTADGDVLVDRIEADHAQVRTGDGDILLNSVDAPISVSSGDGDVQVSLVAAHETRVSTGDGDVTLFAPEDLSAELIIDAEDLDLSPVFTVQGTLRRGVVRGTVNGGGPTIEVRTGDGTVAVRSGG